VVGLGCAGSDCVGRDARGDPGACRTDEQIGNRCVNALAHRVAWEYRAVTTDGQPRQKRGTAGVIAPPPVIYLAFLGLGFAFEWLMPGAELPGWAQWIGAVVIVAGVALMISFELAFKRAGTDANPYRPSTALATDGPYRFSRNPAYLGMAITYVGITLAADAPWALLMLAPATLVIQYGVIAREERYLERLFGEDYLTYKRTTRRWI
jgi:protein-S-isoprenylcysteine O-methyltransferase Ste14